MGKLTATGGVSQVEGAGGGGLTPWALITGYGTRDSYGANAHYTQLNTQDYRLKTYGVAVGIADRVGTLEIGKDATLFVSDGDPLETETLVTAAWIQGRKVDLTSRHTQLYDKYRTKYRQLKDQR